MTRVTLKIKSTLSFDEKKNYIFLRTNERKKLRMMIQNGKKMQTLLQNFLANRSRTELDVEKKCQN